MVHWPRRLKKRNSTVVEKSAKMSIMSLGLCFGLRLGLGLGVELMLGCHVLFQLFRGSFRDWQKYRYGGTIFWIFYFNSCVGQVESVFNQEGCIAQWAKLWVTWVQFTLQATWPYFIKIKCVSIKTHLCTSVPSFFGVDRIAHCVNLLTVVQETWVQFLVGVGKILNSKNDLFILVILK